MAKFHVEMDVFSQNSDNDTDSIELFFEMSLELSVDGISTPTSVITISSSSSQESAEEITENRETSEVDLTATAAKDAALWTDEHTSDEEEFDPNKPEDLTTATAKAEADENDEDDEDDSFVVSDNEEELECANHDACVAAAKKIDEMLLAMFDGVTRKKERRANLTEVLCDNYKLK